MPNTDLTLVNIQEEVELELGGSGTEVELEEKDYKLAIRRAIRIYNRNRPQHAMVVLNASSSQKKYGPISHPGLRGISKVEFVRTDELYFAPFGIVYYLDSYGLFLNGDTWGALDMRLQYREMVERIAGVEPEWYAQQEGDDYYLYVDIGADDTYDVCYEYTFGVTPDNATATGMQHIPEGDVDWVMSYVVAVCKTILGNIRGKHAGGVVGPDGSAVEVKSSTFVDEGKAEMEALMEEIRSRRKPLLPLLE